MLDRLPGGECDFLKVDCEGCEYGLILPASGETLRRIARISMETHEFGPGRRQGALVEHLERHGFDVRTRPNPVHRELGFLTATRRDDFV